jgi:hypothetical protein
LVETGRDTSRETLTIPLNFFRDGCCFEIATFAGARRAQLLDRSRPP